MPGVPTATIVLMGGVGGAENVLSWKAVGDWGGVGTEVVVPTMDGDAGRDPGEDMEEA